MAVSPPLPGSVSMTLKSDQLQRLMSPEALDMFRALMDGNPRTSPQGLGFLKPTQQELSQFASLPEVQAAIRQNPELADPARQDALMRELTAARFLPPEERREFLANSRVVRASGLSVDQAMALSESEPVTSAYNRSFSSHLGEAEAIARETPGVRISYSTDNNGNLVITLSGPGVKNIPPERLKRVQEVLGITADQVQHGNGVVGFHVVIQHTQAESANQAVEVQHADTEAGSRHTQSGNGGEGGGNSDGSGDGGSGDGGSGGGDGGGGGGG